MNNIELLNSELRSDDKTFKSFMFRNLLKVNRLYPVYNSFTIREKIIYNNLLTCFVLYSDKLRKKQNNLYVDSTHNFLHSFDVKRRVFKKMIPIKNKKTGDIVMIPIEIQWSDIDTQVFNKLHKLAN
jgi:hypothetical protein